jgi:hypothetical protein
LSPTTPAHLLNAAGILIVLLFASISKGSSSEGIKT